MKSTFPQTSTRPGIVSRALALARLVLFLALTLSTPVYAAPPAMGVYINGSDEAEHERYEDFTQQSMAPIISFGPYKAVTLGGVSYSGWEALSGRRDSDNTLISPPLGLGWSVNQWTADYKPRVVWSIPMMAETGTTLAQGASGAYDQKWKNVATTLVNAGYGNNTIRIGWEFMGNWFVWGVAGTGSNGIPNTTNYKNYYKKIVLAMRSVPGANFKFNWCGNAGDYYSGSTKMNPADCYPDADANGTYVDEIGIDVYDTHWTYYPVDPAWPQWQKDSARNSAWTAKTTYGTYHMNWWAAFAASKGKPLTIPEWGLAESISQHGGGDNPIFMQKFHEWLINPVNNVKWHAYFQQDDSFVSQFFEKNQTIFPNATDKFLDLYSGRPIFILFQNPVNNVTYVGGYGTKTVTNVGTDAGTAPFEGANQYKITYTTNAGMQFAFNQQNLTQATHLSLAIKGPVTHSTQTLKVRLYGVDGSFGPAVTIPRTTSYQIVDIALSTLGSGVTMTQAKSLYYYATAAPAGTSDTVYLDSITFIQKN